MAIILIIFHIHQGVREKVRGAESCDVSDGDKQDCGVVGTTQVFWHEQQFIAMLPQPTSLTLPLPTR